MTLIDQRIVIDAPPQVVWEYISDPDYVQRWHAGYRSISPLTTQPTGLGTRRRCALETGGKDVIEEITAWVEGLGYEYTQIEGGRHKVMRGRIRLQAGPDGTTVQWTVTYKPRGLVGTINNLFGGRRAMQGMMAESLRRLRRTIDELGLRMDADYRERVSMRDRLNHEERQQYQRRYAEPSEDAAQPASAEPESAVPVSPPGHIEPPPTRELPPLDLDDEPEAAEARQPFPEPRLETGEHDVVPSFVDDLLVEAGGAEDESHAADTEPKPPQGLREALAEQGISEPTDGMRAAPDEQPDAAPPAEGPHAEAQAAQQPVQPPARPSPVVKPQYDTGAAVPPDTPPGAETPAPPESGDAEIDLEAHRRPTPPRGIPSVRSQSEMAPVQPETAPDTPPGAETPADEQALASSAPTPPHGIRSVQPGEQARAREIAEEQAAHHAPESESPVRERPYVPPPTPKTDTGEISIWEVFGTPRPSEQDASALEELIESVNARENAEFRRRTRWAKRPARVRQMQIAIGLRLRLKMQHSRLRARSVRRLFRDRES